MRYLILSDIHANWEALEAVAGESQGRYDRIFCCGDLIGYGADPNPVITWVREHCPYVVRGNHDRASVGMDDLEWFNPVARAAALWTQQQISPEHAEYIRALPKGPLLVDGLQVVHGSPFDEDEYLMAAIEAGQAFSYLESRMAFFGHTHVQGGFIWNHARVETILQPAYHMDRGLLDIDADCAYLLNPGSVGQPRDGDSRAAYLIYDSDAQIASFNRVTYDIAGAQKKIRDAGLPPILADRLTVGR